jgi:hypothetical protein
MAPGLSPRISLFALIFFASGSSTIPLCTSMTFVFCSDVPPTLNNLITKLTHDSQLWSDLLYKSGGSLELPKCTYHFSQYRFATDGTLYLQSGQIGPPVTVCTGDALHSQKVPTSSLYQADKTIGCFKSPSDAQKTQILTKKCVIHARINTTSTLSQLEGWTYYFSKYLTSPGYALPMCHFPLKHLTPLEWKCFPAMFARCGFNCNTSQNVLFVPSKYNGAGFPPFSTEQGVGQLQYFVKQWSHRTEPGSLLQIAVAWVQLNVGVGFSIFNDVVTSLPHFESEWLHSVQDFLRFVQGRLRLDTSFVPGIQQVNDNFIMDHVLERGNFSHKEVRKINYC